MLLNSLYNIITKVQSEQENSPKAEVSTFRKVPLVPSKMTFLTELDLSKTLTDLFQKGLITKITPVVWEFPLMLLKDHKLVAVVCSVCFNL